MTTNNDDPLKMSPSKQAAWLRDRGWSYNRPFDSWSYGRSWAGELLIAAVACELGAQRIRECREKARIARELRRLDKIKPSGGHYSFPLPPMKPKRNRK